VITPEQFGLQPGAAGAVRGGSPAQNAEIIREVLSGRSNSARRDIVVLNAAAALVACGAVGDLDAGVRLAADIVKSGEALGKLDAFVQATQALAA
jgi:anthranilate phosphoribosyltransferase